MKNRFLIPIFLLLTTVGASAQLRTGLGSRLGSSESPAAAAPGTPALSYADPKTYEIMAITTSGTKFYDANSLVSISGLRVGDKIEIPGESISSAVRHLMDQGILDDVQVS